jgi:uncharacterized protein (TIGR02246 family)
MKNFLFNSPQWGRIGLHLILVLATGFIDTELRAQLVVIPNTLATNNGNTSGTGEGTGALHVMQLIDASQFGALSGPSFLTHLSRRPDSSLSPSGPRTATLRVYASTTSRSVADMSTTFSQNSGRDRTLVFDGTVTLFSKNLAGSGDTREFDIVYPFTTPFLYDPAAGNLLLELQTSSSGSVLEWDALTDDPSIQTLLAPGSATAPTGNLGGSAVYQLTFEPAPLVTIRASQAEVCWSSESNATYQVQYSSAITSNIWVSLLACVPSAGLSTCISDPISVGEPRRFYRILETNCLPSFLTATQDVRLAVQSFYTMFDTASFTNVPNFTTVDWAHINPLGGWTQGRTAVVNEISAAHSSFLKGVTDTPEQIEVRFAGTDVAIATVPSKLSPHTTPDGIRRVNQRNIRTFVLVRRNERWLIMQDHNTYIN